MNAPTQVHPPPAKRRKGRKPARQNAPAPVSITVAPEPPKFETRPGVPRRRRGGWLFLSFLCLLALPAALVGHYLFEQAADQYHSRLGFSVRSGTSQQTMPAPDLLGALGGGPSPLVASESYVVYDYLRSQEIVTAVDRDIDLRAVFSRAPDDWVFALGPEASTEDLVRHWRRQVSVVYDTLSGIVTVEVRTFDRDSATALAQAILGHATRLVNDISRAARDDTVGFAEAELGEAEDRLQAARARIRTYRNLEQKTAAEDQIRIATGLIAALERDLAAARVDLQIAGSFTKDDDPRVLRLTNRIAVLEARIADERKRFGRGDGPDGAGEKSLADVIGDFEELEVEREFAETAYKTALAGLQAAKADARRTQRYLAVHIRPTTADAPQYPERFEILGLTIAALFVLWAVSVLIVSNIRDRV